MNDLVDRLKALSPEKQRIVLCRLRGEGWPVPLELRPPAEEVTSLPDLKGEVYLPPEICTPAQPLTLDETSLKPRRVLLTGATGFVGAFLLDELLRGTNAEIVCLVRGPNASHGLNRIVDNLRRLAAPAHLPLERIVALPGDLEKLRFGLSEGEFNQLAGRIDWVVHNGAVVNFLCGYDALIGPNVVGTQEVLRLASAIRAKPLHYISSVGMFLLARHPPERRTVPEDGRLEWGLGCLGGYAQSKWVAEGLVQEARRRGLPTVIHRAGQVLGHSLSGVSNPNDMVIRFALGIAQLGAVVRTSASTDVVPVDGFCRAVVSLAHRQESFGQVFHHLAPLPLEQCASELERQSGRRIRRIEKDEWDNLVNKHIAQTPANALCVLAPFLLARWPGVPHATKTDIMTDIMTVIAQRPPIEFAHTRAALEELGQRYPPPEETLRRSIQWLADTQQLPP